MHLYIQVLIHHCLPPTPTISNHSRPRDGASSSPACSAPILRHHYRNSSRSLLCTITTALDNP
ncbi:hypothetical protein CPC08DRAFT_66667 [Agrocybe pediades]|nr:hypothetical protein CPC08DRAFT_66667 [Agrocybe pediades]